MVLLQHVVERRRDETGTLRTESKLTRSGGERGWGTAFRLPRQ